MPEKQEMSDAGAGDARLEYIQLRVVHKDIEYYFLVKVTAQIGKLKKSFSKYVGVSETSFWFLFNGRCIGDDQTPQQLDMKDNDIIEGFDAADWQLSIGENQNSEGMPKNGEGKYIQVKVVGRNSHTMLFRLTMTTRMGKLKKFYGERVGVSVMSLRFLFNGNCIDDDQTPKQLNMEDNGVIEVFDEAE